MAAKIRKSLHIFFIVCSTLLLLVVQNSVAQNPELTAEAGDLGKIVGARAWTTRNNTAYITFASIPYAHSTAGENRFKPSRLREGPLNATGEYFYAYNPLVACPQRDLFYYSKVDSQNLTQIIAASDKIRREMRSAYKTNGTNKEVLPMVFGPEDCLVLNVNTPKIPEDPEDEEQLYPVIFFIHGGSSDFLWGAPFSGLRLLDRKVVLVTINYRLGVLGALNLGIDDAPGNAAMYDSIVALEWVQKYIKYFGGNPNSVTIYGQSAGSMMVTHLMLSPLAKGRNLFHKVIGQSGSPLIVWGTAVHPSIPHHLLVAEKAGCTSDPALPEIDYQGIADCMKNTDVAVLISALSSYENEQLASGLTLGFDAKSPCIQSPSLTIPIFLDKHPYEILEKGEQSNVPLMAGVTKHDGSYALDLIYYGFIEKNNYQNDPIFLKNHLFPSILKALRAEDPSGSLIHALAWAYLGETKNSGDFQQMIPGLIDVNSVFGFKAGVYQLVQLHANIQPLSYFYSFDYKGLWTVFDFGGSSIIPGGVSHADDLIYVFQLFPLILPNEVAVMKRTIDYITNFAKYGDPNGEEPVEEGKRWLPYSPENHPYFSIDKEDSIKFNCLDSWVNNSLELGTVVRESQNEILLE